MPIIVKMNNDKTLQVTNLTNVYHHENNADDFLFLLPQYYENKSIRDCEVTFNWENENNEGNAKLLTFSDDLYKDEYLQATEPVTMLHTSVVGKVKLWFSIANSSNELVLKSGEAYIPVK